MAIILKDTVWDREKYTNHYDKFFGNKQPCLILIFKPNQRLQFRCFI